MRERESIEAELNSILDEEGQEAVHLAVQLLLDCRDLLQKSEDRMVRMEADIANRLQQ